MVRLENISVRVVCLVEKEGEETVELVVAEDEPVLRGVLPEGLSSSFPPRRSK